MRYLTRFNRVFSECLERVKSVKPMPRNFFGGNFAGKFYCVTFAKQNRGVAQLASALAWGARGRKFESSHPDF